MKDLSVSGLRPLREGIFLFDDNGRPTALIAGRCTGCGTITFPARKRCGVCDVDGPPEAYPLTGEGRIYTATRVYVPSALGHQPPYAYGYVDLPTDGARIFAPLMGDEHANWEPGRAVKLGFYEVPASKMPGMLGYAFTPCPRGDDA